MFKNYFIVAIRNITRHKVYSLINIFGLAVGMATCILILLWVEDELSFDRYHHNSEHLYRVVEYQYYSGSDPFPVAVTPGPLAATLKAEYPEVLNACRLNGAPRMLLKYDNQSFYESGLILADPEIFDMFDFRFIMGNPETALADLKNIVLTRTLAKKYFGTEDPIGKVITIEEALDFTVAGVVDDAPHNSHIQYSCIVPFEFLRIFGRNPESWDNNSYYTYVLLNPQTDPVSLGLKIEDEIERHNEGSVTKLALQPLSEIHLHSDFVADWEGHGNIIYVRIFSIIALFVLLVACINFMNLTTARSVSRARETGIRKVLGAYRNQLIRQHFTESIALVLLSLLIAIILVVLLLPTFNHFTGKSLNLYVLSFKILLGIGGIAIITGLLAGSYPALYLSSFRPVKVLQGTLLSGKRAAGFRKLLVVIQFALSVGLIIATLTISRQLNYIQHKNLGFNRNQVIYFRIPRSTQQQYYSMKNELSVCKGVNSVSRCSELPTHIRSSTSGFSWEGKNPDETVLFHILSSDFNLDQVLELELAEGRFFDALYPSDSSNGVVVNERAAAIIGRENIIGKSMNIYGTECHIIGVVKDFHFKPMQKEIEPLVFPFIPSWQELAVIRIETEAIPETIREIRSVWEKFNPNHPLEYSFLDESFNQLYRAEMQMSSLFRAFSILAVFISCLGLFGLSAFMVEKRMKEIGVRKVFGASVSNIILLLTSSFTRWVLLANLFAWPVAYFAMHHWLANYAYRAEFGISLFLLAGGLSILVAVFTVAFQSLKAALSNPIDTIKYE
jgi:ABC-type antimicrobial peptide transport system permease subunit